MVFGPLALHFIQKTPVNMYEHYAHYLCNETMNHCKMTYLLPIQEKYLMCVVYSELGKLLLSSINVFVSQLFFFFLVAEAEYMTLLSCLEKILFRTTS